MHSKSCSKLPHAYQAGTKQGGDVPENLGRRRLGQLHFDWLEYTRSSCETDHLHRIQLGSWPFAGDSAANFARLTN
jgi:hypothetical protein